jgi:hypothetical protein
MCTIALQATKAEEMTGENDVDDPSDWELRKGSTPTPPSHQDQSPPTRRMEGRGCTPSEKRIKKATMRAKSAIASERAKPKMA